MSPLAAGVLVLAVIGGMAGTYWAGERAGRDGCQAEAAREERVAQVATDAANAAAAKAIAGIQVKHTTIRQEVQREIRERPVYRDCRHPDGQLQRLNSALAGDATELAGPGDVRPGSRPAD